MVGLNRRHWLAGAAATLAILPVRSLAEDQAKAPNQAKDPLPRLTPAQIREDLTFLRSQWAPLEQSLGAEQRQTFERLVADAMAGADTASIEDLALDVMRAVAVARNGHTSALVGRLLGDLPIRAWWFSDGLYILKAEPAHAELVGARIERFGTLTAEEALGRVAPYISGTDQRIRSLGAAYLTSPAMLRRIGVEPQAGAIPLTLRLRDGRSTTVNLSPAALPDPGDPNNVFGKAWSVLIPDEKDLPGRWAHVLDGVDRLPPTYAKPAGVSMQWLGPNESVLYVRSNWIDGKDRIGEALLFGVLQNQVVPRQPRCVVIDLRLNNGGNFFETMLFAQGLPPLMPAGGQIFVLVSRATFSAALTTAAMLKRAGPANVKLVGEPMGDNGRFWSEPGKKTLPNSKITVLYSTKLEDFEQGCPDLDRCYWAVTAFVHGTVSLAPDVRVDVSFSEYASGGDPVLDKALAMAGQL